jgi:predicted ATPase/class 3 adenylate cyclase/DNA-binding XRE family transcriptional regulator
MRETPSDGRSDGRSDNQSAAVSTAQPTFGELLRRYRLARRLTQAELAERAGLSTRGINDLERGARTAPRRDTVTLLAGALDLSVEERAAFLAAARRPPTIEPRYQSTEAPFQPSEHLLAATSSSRHALLPTGTVTFLFTDIEHSTQILQRLGDRYAEALDASQRILRAAFAARHGREVDTQGDSFFAVFGAAHDALAAAVQAQRALAAERWPLDIPVRVRMGLHTGSPLLVAGHYVGFDVHRAARIGAAAHGGQILLSTATAELARGALDGLPNATELRDLGEHRLKDLRAPERLWQLVVEDLPHVFPPPRALDRHAHNLPIQPTLLLGRSREIAEVTRLLREGAWLVTVTGPPGVGKTHLGLQVAAELTGANDLFPDGVWFVRLSRLGDPALVLATIAHELGLRPHGMRSVAEALGEYLSDKRLLLALDNFEHVAAAAGDLAALRQRAPGVRMLVTSRAPLRLRGEREYALAALPVPATDGPPPTPERLAPFASIRLFSERAQAAVSDFAVTLSSAPVVAEICSRLDGLPLALELAAARVKFLPLDALLTRLERSLPLLSDGPRDAEEHHRTMRATIAWSEELLTDDERILFRRLAVFAGGATLEAVEAVCLSPEGAQPLDLDVLSGLAALMDQSLVQRREEHGQPRYGMLHVVREYALEQLEASGEAETLRRAALLACLRLSERYGPLLANGHADWLAQMGAESHNLHAALAWAAERGEAELGLRLVIGAAQYWFVRGHAQEGYRWLTRMLQIDDETPRGSEAPAGESRREWARRWALAWVVEYAANMSETGVAATRSHELLARAVGDRATEALALWSLGDVDLTRSAHPIEEPDAAEHVALLRQAIVAARQSGDEAVMTYQFVWIGFNLVAADPTLVTESLAITEEGLRLARRLESAFSELAGCETLAYLSTLDDDIERARSAISRALEIIYSFDYDNVMELTLGTLAAMAAHEGRATRAARLGGAADATEELHGLSRGSTGELAPVQQTQAALGAEAWAAAYAAGCALTHEEALAEAWREARGEPEEPGEMSGG